MTSFRLPVFHFLSKIFYFCSHIAECANIAEFANIAEIFCQQTFANRLSIDRYFNSNAFYIMK